MSASVGPADGSDVVSRRVGPGAATIAAGSRSTALAADNHFASALITLWHRVSQDGGAVGFDREAARWEIAPTVTEAVNGLRAGSRHAVVLTAGNELVAAAFLVPRPNRIQRHLADVRAVMVDPAWQRRGHGRRLLDDVASLGTELGVGTLLLTARDGLGLDAFCAKVGYTEYGRLPDAVRPTDGSSAAEVLYRRSISADLS